MPTKPLPSNWANCYHASFETVTLRAPVAYAKRDLAVNMPQYERAKHIFATITDQKLANQLAKKDHSINIVPMVDYSRQPDVSPPSGHNGDTAAGPRQPISSGARSLSLASDEEHQASKLVPPLVSIMSYDLSLVSAVADPQGLFAEISFIEKHVNLLIFICTVNLLLHNSGCSRKQNYERPQKKRTKNKSWPAL